MIDIIVTKIDDLNNKMSEPPTKIVKLDSVFG